VEHLVHVRFHPRTFAGGEDDGGEIALSGHRLERANGTETLPFP
jgi:hypothetical protein